MRKFEGYEKGINLGGWLSQCVHTTEHYESFITEKDFAEIARWGVDHVRVPVDYDLLEDESGAPTAYGMKYLERAVEWSGRYHLRMVLDLHKAAGYSFDSGEGESGFFESGELQERFYRLWERIAEAFGAYSGRVAFELLNEVVEPSCCERWNRIAETCVRRIRAYAPDSYILIGGYWHNSVEALPDIAPPFDDRIVYNFHCYEPLVFTHQGAGWMEEMPSDFRVRYGEICEKAPAVAAKLSQHAGFTLEKPVNADTFREFFAGAVRVAEERNVPLYCGEYGVIDLADPESTLEWYRDIHAAFQTYGIARAAWSWKQMDFGLSDERLAPVAEELKRLL